MINHSILLRWKRKYNHKFVGAKIINPFPLDEDAYIQFVTSMDKRRIWPALKRQLIGQYFQLKVARIVIIIKVANIIYGRMSHLEPPFCNKPSEVSRVSQLGRPLCYQPSEVSRVSQLGRPLCYQTSEVSRLSQLERPLCYQPSEVSRLSQLGRPLCYQPSEVSRVSQLGRPLWDQPSEVSRVSQLGRPLWDQPSEVSRVSQLGRHRRRINELQSNLCPSHIWWQCFIFCWIDLLIFIMKKKIKILV